MRTLAVETLSWESFSPFGTYLDPGACGPALANETGPIRFFPDRIMLLFEQGNLAAVSPLVLDPRDLAIDVTERHLHTEEAIGGFTRDVVFHVGPAEDGAPDLNAFRVFRLPAGWWVRLKRGVWHHAPFVQGPEGTVGIVILPPATYTNDCQVVEVGEKILLTQTAADTPGASP